MSADVLQSNPTDADVAIAGPGLEFLSIARASWQSMNSMHRPTGTVKTFHIDCELSYDVPERTLFLLSIAPPSTDAQNVCAESITISPDVSVDQLQAAGSTNRVLRLVAPPGALNIRYLANVDVLRTLPGSQEREVSVEQLPAEVLPYLVASRYCESDLLFPMACWGIRSPPA